MICCGLLSLIDFYYMPFFQICFLLWSSYNKMLSSDCCSIIMAFIDAGYYTCRLLLFIYYWMVLVMMMIIIILCTPGQVPDIMTRLSRNVELVGAVFKICHVFWTACSALVRMCNGNFISLSFFYFYYYF